MKSISSKQITEIGPDLKLQTNPELHLNFENVLPPQQALPTSLVFASDKKLFLEALQKNVRGFVIKDSLWPEVKDLIQSQHQVWTTSHIQYTMTFVLKLFDAKQEFLKASVHPTAIIHPTAHVDSTAHIGAYVVIEAFAEVGANTIIYPHAYVGLNCRVGQRCLIAPYACIGFDGFGFFTDKKNQHHKIPQIGHVIIEDDCEIGAHCAIDRATLTATTIKRGSKLDNFCHISHNVEIGANAMITAGFVIAGSTKIGRNFTTAGGVHVNGHIEITDNVVLSGRAGVTNTITEAGIYGGFPLESHRESLKTLTSIPHIKKLRKQVSRILKHLNLQDDEDSKTK